MISLLPSSHGQTTWRSVLTKTYIMFPVGIILLVFLIYSCSRFTLLKHLDLKSLSLSKSPARGTDEVYATLFCPPAPTATSRSEINYYFEAIRILAYRLLHKPSTKDLHGRRLIVLATEGVLPEQIRQLQFDGAIVRAVFAISPPNGTDLRRINQRWKDQYTKLILWNMTQYSKILYMDADLLPIRSLSAVFDTPLRIDKESHPYLFAAVYDSGGIRDGGRFSRPIPVLGPNDTHAESVFSAGLFLIHPSHRQANYVQSIYNSPPKGQDFTQFMEQSMLRYAYRDGGDYPWTRLSQMYNTQWPRFQDLEASHALHDKMWREDSPVAWNLRKFWYVAWGEMQGWSYERQRSRKGGIVK